MVKLISSYADKRKKEAVVISKEILDKVKEAKCNSNINKEQRALVLLELAKGKAIRDVASDFKYSTATIQTIKNDNASVLAQIKTNLLEKEVKQSERIIYQYLTLLESKGKRLANDEAKLDTTKASELASVVKTIFDKVQLEQGKPTAITKYDGTGTKELKAELIRRVQSIDGTNTEELIRLFKNA